ELHALKTTRQKSRVPLAGRDGLVLTGLASGDGDHEARQILTFAAPAVDEPGSHRGPPGKKRPPIHESMRRVVVNGFPSHGPDDANVVRHGTDLRKDLADFLTVGATFLEGMLRREAVELLTLKLRNRLPLRKRVGHRLAVHLR